MSEPKAVPSGVRVAGTVRPPSSKSLTQRFYNLALLADSPSYVGSPLESEDCLAFLDGLEAVGCGVDRESRGVRITPALGRGRATIDCRASGTMLRLMTASLAAVPGTWRLDGVDRLRERPLAPLLEALANLGATVECHSQPGFAPLTIAGGGVGGGRTKVSGALSSQFVSALLMMGAATERGVTLEVDELVSAPYVGLTSNALAQFGVELAGLGSNRLTVPGGPFKGATVEVEPDASSACYPAAAAALAGGTVLIEGLGRDSAQGDVHFVNLLERMGARVDWSPSSFTVTGTGALRALEADLSDLPDQVPTLAAIAPFAEGDTVISNVAHLRLKESDRLAAMTGELRKLGAVVEERADGLTISGTWCRQPPPDDAVVVDAHDDHRIAMSLALAALRRPGVSVADPEVVAKSYPSFWNDLSGLLEA